MGAQLRRWPWLIEELVRAFWLRFYGYLYGGGIIDGRWSESVDPPAGRAELSFAVQTGETVSESLARLVQEIERTFTAICLASPETLPAGDAISDEERIRIDRDVDWWYRARVKSPADSVRSIAIGEAADRGDPRRSV